MICIENLRNAHHRKGSNPLDRYAFPANVPDSVKENMRKIEVGSTAVADVRHNVSEMEPKPHVNRTTKEHGRCILGL